MLLKEGEQCLLRLFGVGSLESMAGAFQRDQLHFDAAGLQAVSHPNRLLMRHILIIAAMKQQGGRRVRGGQFSGLART